MVIKKNKLLDKFVIKNYNNKLEEVLTTKMFREDVKNLLLDILYKIETSYQDYSKVKKNVLSKEEYINNIINIIKNDCDSIKFISPNSKECQNIDNISFIVDKEKKEIKCYPIARNLLYSLAKIQKSEDIIKIDSDLLNKTLTNTLNIGNNINTIEPLRDFNGFSWNISVSEIENLYYNLIYQNLIILVGNKFLEEWTNENKCIIEYMELFKSEIEKEYGQKLSKNIIETLKNISILLEFTVNKEFRSEIKDRKEFVQEQLEIMNNKETYLKELCVQKKNIERKIKSIDLLINNKELLHEKYLRVNNDLPLEQKIFSTRSLAKKMLQEREDLLNQLKEYNELMNPTNFIARKDEMKEEYKYLVLVDIEKIEKEILKNIILLQKYVIEALMVKIEKANDRNDLIKVMYEIRYFYLLPVTEGKRIKDMKKLSKLIDMLNNEFFTKAYNLKLLNKICKNDIQNIDILKNIFSLQIISLESIYLKILKNEDGFYVQFYDEDIVDEKFKITQEIEKEELKINRKTKLFI